MKKLLSILVLSIGLLLVGGVGFMVGESLGGPSLYKISTGNDISRYGYEFEGLIQGFIAGGVIAVVFMAGVILIYRFLKAHRPRS